jgi:hypothetical protein
MTTVVEIINKSLKMAGVIGQGQTAAAEDINDCFDELNFMISQWNRKRWLIYHLKDVSVTSTGAQFYTVGTGQDFNTVRPEKIQAAYMRQLTNGAPNQVDYPMISIDSYEDYSRIALKQLTSFTWYFFYDSAFPVAKFYPYPITQANTFSLHIIVKDLLTEFTSIAETINLPPEYRAALQWNLAARIRPMYQLPPEPSIIALASDALNVLRTANTQISTLSMPRNLQGTGAGFNIYTGNTV